MISPKILPVTVLLLTVLSSCGEEVEKSRVAKVSGLMLDGLTNQKKALRTGPQKIDRSAGVLAVQRETGGQAAGLGLVARDGDIATWSTLDGTTLTLNEGVVISTTGFGPDLFSADADPIHDRPDGSAWPRVHRYVDGENHVQMQAYMCRLSVERDATVTLQNGTVNATRYTESCTGPETEFENNYLYSKSGQLLASRQWIGADIGYLALQMPAK